MVGEGRRWWDGPWPWLVYLPTYAIPWLWSRPDGPELLLSALGFGVFLPAYFMA
jgi:two-component system sensor histidine kinase DesK